MNWPLFAFTGLLLQSAIIAYSVARVNKALCDHMTKEGPSVEEIGKVLGRVGGLSKLIFVMTVFSCTCAILAWGVA